MKFATVDANGAVSGFYDDIARAPQRAVQITDEQWQEWLGNQYTRAWRNDTLVTVGPPPPRPIPPVPPSPRQWLERLSPEKQAAIASGGLANAAVLLWLLKASGSSTIDVTLQETIDGVAALVSAGILTADDQAVLLAP
jgi:hypothetical protein